MKVVYHNQRKKYRGYKHLFIVNTKIIVTIILAVDEKNAVKNTPFSSQIGVKINRNPIGNTSVTYRLFKRSDIPTTKARWVLIYIHFQIYSKVYKTNKFL